MTENTKSSEGDLPPAVQIRNKQQQRNFALVIGIIALALPTILWVGPKIFGGCERYTLSHFYYSPFYGGFFIGMMAFIGTFMVAYDSKHPGEKFVAKAAGLCAYVVAFVPATDHGCLSPESFRARAFLRFVADKRSGDDTLFLRNDDFGTHILSEVEFFQLNGYPLGFGLSVADLHYIFASLLFGALAYFCFFVFFPVSPRHRNQNGKWKLSKIIRNLIYALCGMLIVLSMISIGLEFKNAPPGQPPNSDWNSNRMTFWWEATAIWAFGLSWVVKGKAFERLIERFTNRKVVPPEIQQHP